MKVKGRADILLFGADTGGSELRLATWRPPRLVSRVSR